MTIKKQASIRRALNRRSKPNQVVHAVISFVMAAAGGALYQAMSKSRWRGKARHRERKSMENIYEQLGDYYFRHAYRMTYDTFCKLNNLLQGTIARLAKKPGSNPAINRNAPNGRIDPAIRLGVAIRYFAGGSVYDIMTTFGIGRADVSKSTWLVIEAINKCDFLDIKFPREHSKQLEIARQFQLKSSANFDCCVGAVDGILIWIHQPTNKDAAKSKCGPQKFYCGRKHKFGLNCQAICDANGKFLDISVMYPGSSSDILAFESTTIYSKLQGGLLAPDLCLFGDNAYVNTKFMATPFSNVSGGSKDAYNFYHSQLRINIECTFGKFVHRWAILRAAVPMNITISKTSAMVVAMAKLHNFCIDHKDSPEQGNPHDLSHIGSLGAVPMIHSD
jgi:hypothetical protein